MNFLFNRSTNGGFDNVNVAKYKDEFVDGHQVHSLVDVRTPGEYLRGHLPSAINIPLDQLQRRTHEIPNDKPIVVVCATGNRSQSGARILLSAGFTDVYNLQGGTMAWMMNGNSVER